MLVLSRKVNEQILIDGNIRITVVMVRGNQVRLGIEAPDDVAIYRKELCDAARPPRAAHLAPAGRDGDETSSPVTRWADALVEGPVTNDPSDAEPAPTIG